MLGFEGGVGSVRWKGRGHSRERESHMKGVWRSGRKEEAARQERSNWRRTQGKPILCWVIKSPEGGKWLAEVGKGRRWQKWLPPDFWWTEVAKEMLMELFWFCQEKKGNVEERGCDTKQWFPNLTRSQPEKHLKSSKQFENRFTSPLCTSYKCTALISAWTQINLFNLPIRYCFTLQPFPTFSLNLLPLFSHLPTGPYPSLPFLNFLKMFRRFLLEIIFKPRTFVSNIV